jgi:predicted RNase H-like nuclease (RuvC/YqgF family)
VTEKDQEVARVFKALEDAEDERIKVVSLKNNEISNCNEEISKLQEKVKNYDNLLEQLKQNEIFVEEQKAVTNNLMIELNALKQANSESTIQWNKEIKSQQEEIQRFLFIIQFFVDGKKDGI